MNGCNETIATLIGIGIGIFFSYAIFPLVWRNIIKPQISKIRARIGS